MLFNPNELRFEKARLSREILSLSDFLSMRFRIIKCRLSHFASTGCARELSTGVAKRKHGGSVWYWLRRCSAQYAVSIFGFDISDPVAEI